MKPVEIEFLMKDKLSDGIVNVKEHIQDLGKTARTEGTAIDNMMKKIGLGISLYLSIDQLKAFATQVANVRGQFQQLEIAFKTMLGSKEQADALMSQLIKTAAITPFGMNDVANGAKQLLAFGVEAESVNDTLTRLGDIAAGLSIPLNDLIYLYGTTMTQGRMFTQDLRQFMSRGIPLAEELAKQFGVAKNQVEELVTAGKVGAKEVQEAIWAMTNEGSKFGGLMEAQSKSITGQISNIEDAVEQMFNEIGKSSEGAISGILEGVGSVVEHWEEIAKVIAVVIAAYGAYKGAVLATMAIQKMSNVANSVGAFLSLAKSITSAKDAMLLFNMATRANPIGFIVSVLATAATAFFAFRKSAESAAQMSERFGKSAQKATTEVENLYSVMNVSSHGSKVQKDAMSDLIKVMEEYGIKVDKEKATTEELNALHQQLTETIRQESIERERANAIDTFNTKYTDSVKAAVEEARESLSGIRGGDAIVQVGFTQLVDKEQLKEYNKLLQEYYATRDAHLREHSDKSRKLLTEAHSRLVANDKELEKNLHTILKRAGVTEFGHIREAENAFWEYRNSINEANVELEANVSVANDAATAAQELSSATDAMTAEQRLAAKQMQILKEHSHDLRSYLENLAKTYKITIDFEQTNVPSWMSGINAKRSKELAAFYSAVVDQNLRAGRKGSNVKQADGSFQYMSNEEMMQRAGGYAKNADAKDAETKKKEQEAPQKKTKKRTGKSEAQKAKEKAEEERKKLEAEKAERLQQIKEYGQKIAEEAERAELDIRQRQIEAMEEGFDKERAQLALNYDRLQAENKERRQKMLEDLADNKVNEWLNRHPKATKQEQTAYRNSLLDPKSLQRLTDIDLTLSQREQLKAYDAINQQIKLKQEQDLYKRLIDQYQDYASQRLSIAERYDEDEAALMSQRTEANAAVVDAAIAQLRKARQEALKQVDAAQIEDLKHSSAVFKELFSGMADNTRREVQAVIAQMEQLLDYLKRKDITPTQRADMAKTLGITPEALGAIENSPEKIDEIGEAVKRLKGTMPTSPFQKFTESLGEAIKKLNSGDIEEGIAGIVGAVKDFAPHVKQFGNDLGTIFGDAEIGDKVGRIVDAVEGLGTTAMGVGRIMAGDVVGGTMAVVSGVAQMVKALDGLFGANYDKYNAAKKQYEDYMAVLDGVIERQRKMVESLDATNALKSYEHAKKLVEGSAETARQLGRERLNAGASAGSHSIGVRQRKKFMNDQAWAEAREALGSAFDTHKIGDGRMIGLFDLSIAQMEKLRDEAPMFWAKLDGDVRKYMEDIIKSGEGIDDLKKSLTENLTATSFDSLYDGFLSTLEDMSKGTSDFADDFQKKMQKAVLSSLMKEKVEKQLKAWHDSFAKANEDSRLSDNELLTLRQQWDDIVQGAISQRNALMESMGIANTTAQQANRGNSFSTLTQSQGTKLEGLFTAGQIHWSSMDYTTQAIAKDTTLVVGTLASIKEDTLYLRHLKTLDQRIERIERDGLKVK